MTKIEQWAVRRQQQNRKHCLLHSRENSNCRRMIEQRSKLTWYSQISVQSTERLLGKISIEARGRKSSEIGV